MDFVTANASQQHMHVTVVDLDQRCAHMAYVQFSLLPIPVVVVHVNSLTVEEYSHWYTPAHIMDKAPCYQKHYFSAAHFMERRSHYPEM